MLIIPSLMYFTLYIPVYIRVYIEKVKARIIEKDGASGIHNVTRILNRMDTDGSRNLDQNELMRGLNAYGIKKIPPRDMKILFNYFDRDRSGRISVDEFLRGLKVCTVGQEGGERNDKDNVTM